MATPETATLNGVRRPITVDDRIGSGELVRLFPPGVTVRKSRLDYGDFAFTGQGPEGLPFRIGIERKKLADLLSGMARFGGRQLPGMLNSYNESYLILEEEWRRGPRGLLQIYRKGGWRELQLGTRTFLSRELDGYLSTLEAVAGVKLRLSRSPAETVEVVVNLYRWWQRDYEEHRSHQVGRFTCQLRRPSLAERVAGELPGIGAKKAREVVRQLTSVKAMVEAELRDWTAVPGVGKIMASRIIRALEGKES